MTQQLPDSMPRVPAEDEPRIQRRAVLALVFAVLVPPVGIALGIQVLRRTRRDSADGTRAIAALLVALAVGISEVVLLLTYTTGTSTPSATAAAPAGTPDPRTSGRGTCWRGSVVTSSTCSSPAPTSRPRR